MGNPLEWITRGCRGRRGAFGGGAARWWADVAGERCPANAVVFGLSSLAQKGGMGSGVLTGLGFEGEGRAKSMAMLTGGGAGTVVAGGVRRRFSGRLDSVGRLVVHLQWCHVVREVREWPAARKKNRRRRDSLELMS